MSSTTKWILIGGAALLVILFLVNENKSSAATVNNYSGAAGWLTGIGNLISSGSKAYTNVTGSGKSEGYSPDIVYGSDSSVGGD